MNDLYNVKRKVGEPLVTCRGKVIGVVKRRKAKRYTRPSKVKVIKQG